MKTGVFLAALLSGCLAVGPAQETPPPALPPVDPAALATFRQARFGLFIHWGPVSLRGTEIGWSRGREIPREDYDRLYQSFNPVHFDAEAWVLLACEAGMRYLVITAKHHDGFCLWPSEHTDYDLASTPFQRDILLELAQACRKHGLGLGIYYSLCDWHHPDYPRDSPAGRGRKPASDIKRYVRFVRAQLEELLERYGPLQVLWFDGEWEEPWTTAQGRSLYTFLKGRQPDLLINNRLDKGRQGLAGTTAPGALGAGDFDTPEQRVGAFDRERPWETCMTLGRQWAWKPDDLLKSTDACLRILMATAGGDGNLLLNIGPMPDGRIEPRQEERLREVGAWLQHYGEAIYGTRGGPFKPGSWGVSTCRGSRVHLFVTRWPRTGALRLPSLPLAVTSARVLSGGEPVLEVTKEALVLWVDAALRQRPATVIEINLAGPAVGVEPQEVWWLGPPLRILAARASNVFQGKSEYAPARAFDGDPTTRWATDAGTETAWLEAQLEEPCSVSAVRICEAYPGRVEAFAFEAWRGDGWEVLHQGATLGEEAVAEFDAVVASRFRLNILRAQEGPTFWEVALFSARAR